jgi:hypothetical protein
MAFLRHNVALTLHIEHMHWILEGASQAVDFADREMDCGRIDVVSADL